MHQVCFYADKDYYNDCCYDQNNLQDFLVGGIIHLNIQILFINFLKNISI